MHDVVALHALETGMRVGASILEPVAHMQIARWVREHHKRKEIFLAVNMVGGSVNTVFLPFHLPFFFDFSRRVTTGSAARPSGF